MSRAVTLPAEMIICPLPEEPMERVPLVAVSEPPETETELVMESELLTTVKLELSATDALVWICSVPRPPAVLPRLRVAPSREAFETVRLPVPAPLVSAPPFPRPRTPLVTDSVPPEARRTVPVEPLAEPARKLLAACKLPPAIATVPFST